MSETSIKVSLELVDKAAQKALTDFIAKSDQADKSVGKINTSTNTLASASANASNSFSGLIKIVTEDLGGKGSSAVGNFASLLNGPLLISIGSVGVAALAMSKALDLTLTAERNSQVRNSFEAIASAAGLAGDEIESGILTAVRGLADDDDTLAAASKSIIELGRNASAIPEIMEIARKATALMGGDLLQRFEDISQALASGNTKALKNIGLVIESDAAEKKYAQTLGVKVERLTDAGKKQAIFNEAMDAAKIKFAGVDEETNKATQSLQRLKVQIGGLGDTIADTARQSGFFATVFNFVGEAAEGASLFLKDKFGGELDKTNGKLRSSQQAITNYSSELRYLESAIKDSAGVQRSVLQASIDSTRAKLNQAKADFASYSSEIKKATLEASGSFVKLSAMNPSKKGDVKAPETDAFGKKLADEYRNAETQAQMQLQILQAQKDQELIIEADFQARKAAIVQEAFIRENQQLTTARQQGRLTETQYIAARDQLANKFAADQARRDADSFKADKEVTKRKKQEEDMRAENMRGTLGYIATLQQSNSKELFAVGKAAALGMAYIDAQAAVTKALASAPPPFNFALAGAVGAAAAVNIARIASASFGQGGSVSTPSASMPSMNQQTATKLDLSIAEKEAQMDGSEDPSLLAEVEALKLERDRLQKQIEIERLREEVGRFATGGIVPGNSFTGDNLTARVNSDEMILNRNQQAKLFEIANNGGGSAVLEQKLDTLITILANKDEQLIVQVGGKTVVDSLRSELNSGRSI